MERNKTTQNIGALHGKILVFGGVYSNFQALKRLQQIAESLEISPSNIICTGDIVGYCAQPEECINTIKQWGINSIAGNVEIQLRENKEDCGCDFVSGGRCDTFSRQWYPYSQKKLSKASIEWMKSLPDYIHFTYSELNGVVVHGSFHDTSEYIFKSSPWAIKLKNFKDSLSNIILAGHSGLPFTDKSDNHYWLNSGVIGMPANNGEPNVWYMVLDEQNNGEITINHYTLEYNFIEAFELMIKNGLPQEYANTLKNGIWDNCEILPLEESQLQGKSIDL